MTDLLTTEDTGEIRGRAGLGDESTRRLRQPGESTENLAPYDAGLRPVLRRADATGTGEIYIPATIGVVDQAVAQPVAPLERVVVLDDELRPAAPGPLPSPLPAPPPAPPRPSGWRYEARHARADEPRWPLVLALLVSLLLVGGSFALGATL